MYPIEESRCVEHLAGLVRFPTVSNSDDELMDFEPFFAMHRYLEQAYPLVHATLDREIVGRAGLLYHWKGTGKSSNPPLLFMAHQDVVPEGDPNSWTYPPYEGRVSEGQVWGRGSGDCKANIVAQLEAVEHLISTGYQPDFDVYLAYGYNEEVGSGKGEGSSAYMISHLLEDRGVRLGGVLDEGSGLHLDTGIDPPRYVCSITLGEKGYADYEISRSDPGGHSSAPGKKGGLYYIAKAIEAIEENPFHYRLTPVMVDKYKALAPLYKDEKMRRVFSDLEANWEEAVPIIDADRQLAAMFHTTMAVTMASGSAKENILPERASINVNVRLLDGDTLEDAQKHLESIVPAECRVRLVRGNEASPTSVYEGRFKDLIVDICRERSSGDMLTVPGIMAGGTDAKYMYNICDHVYRFSSFISRGEPGGGAHQANESMSIAQLVSGPEFYIQLIKRYGTA